MDTGGMYRRGQTTWRVGDVTIKEIDSDPTSHSKRRRLQEVNHLNKNDILKHTQNVYVPVTHTVDSTALELLSRTET
jgi:hypothetical protein